MTEVVIALEREYHTRDKAEWGDGPWLSEPDKAQWTDPATGLPCLAVRGQSGALCGYVGVTEGHPFFGVGYDADATLPVNHRCDEPYCRPSPEHVLDVHGGVTFSEACDDGAEDRAICHTPKPGESDHVWWIGFDCAHFYDFSPDYDRWVETYMGRLPGSRIGR